MFLDRVINGILTVYVSVQSKYKSLGQCTDLASSVCTIDLGLCISLYRNINSQYPDNTSLKKVHFTIYRRKNVFVNFRRTIYTIGSKVSHFLLRIVFIF